MDSRRKDEWRVILDGAGEAAWNMALDEALLASVMASASPPTLRFYAWERPALSVGRFQNIARTIHLPACERRGLPIVRRITGGRGILHGADLTISIAAPTAALCIGENAGVLALYERLAQGFLRAFASWGLPATMGACGRLREGSGDCFAIASRADIVAAETGRKLLGAALHRRERGILLQTSLPLRAFLPLSMRMDDEALRRDVFPGACAPQADIDLPPIEAQAIRERLIECFGIALGVTLASGVLTAEERREAEDLRASRYANLQWTLAPP